MFLQEIMIIPVFFAIFYLSGSLIYRYTSIAKDLSKGESYNTIEGLRGLAALLVITHHSILSYVNAKTGSWSFPTADGINYYLLSYFKNSGPIGVVIFFMITGFLFSGKIIKSNGKIEYIGFYKKRFMRIAPLYYFSVFILLTISLFLTFNKATNVWEFINKFFGWLCFYFIKYEGFSHEFPYSRLNGGVFWTLAIEWKVYFLIPVVSVFISERKRAFYFAIISTILILALNKSMILSDMDSSIIISFISGIAAYLVTSTDSISKTLKKNVFGLIPLAIILYMLFSSAKIYTPSSVLLISIAFIIMSSGNNVFRTIDNNSIKAIGVISYSIYLMHCIVLNIINRYLWDFIGFNLTTILSIVIIFVVCSATYIYIERPAMKKGNELKREVY